MKTLLILTLAILSIAPTCQKSEEIEYNVDYMAYGTSFGECLGYCKKEVVISGSIEFTKSGWDMGGPLPDSTCSLIFIRNPLPDYIDKMNIDEFLELDFIIGCPDCADGGAEWLELSIDGDVKRVTFEYMNEPPVLEVIIADLRELMESFDDCGRVD